MLPSDFGKAIPPSTQECSQKWESTPGISNATPPLSTQLEIVGMSKVLEELEQKVSDIKLEAPAVLFSQDQSIKSTPVVTTAPLSKNLAQVAAEKLPKVIYEIKNPHSNLGTDIDTNLTPAQHMENYMRAAYAAGLGIQQTSTKQNAAPTSPPISVAPSAQHDIKDIAPQAAAITKNLQGNISLGLTTVSNKAIPSPTPSTAVISAVASPSQPPAEHNLKVSIKGLPANTSPELLEKELRKLGYIPECIQSILGGKGRPSWFLAVLRRTENLIPGIYAVTELLRRTGIKIEPWRESSRPEKCALCDKFHYISLICNRRQACIRCGQENLKQEISSTQQEIGTCANCGGTYAANYRSCPVYKRDKRAGTPALTRKARGPCLARATAAGPTHLQTCHMYRNSFLTPIQNRVARKSNQKKSLEKKTVVSQMQIKPSATIAPTVSKVATVTKVEPVIMPVATPASSFTPEKKDLETVKQVATPTSSAGPETMREGTIKPDENSKEVIIMAIETMQRVLIAVREGNPVAPWILSNVAELATRQGL